MSRCLALLAICVVAGCSPTERGDDDRGGGTGIDAGTTGAKHDGGGGGDATLTTPDAAAPAQPTQFPINGPNASSPVIADVTLSCHAQYSPRVLRVYVIVTDAQGPSNRSAGSGVLKLPDGTNVSVTMSEPPDYSQYDERIHFGTGQTLTQAQFDQACAAQLLQISLTFSDHSGNVTIAPMIHIAPTVGGQL